MSLTSDKCVKQMAAAAVMEAAFAAATATTTTATTGTTSPPPIINSAAAPPLPPPQTLRGGMEFRPSFEIFDPSLSASTSKTSENGRLRVRLKTENYDPLKKWCPYIDWDGSFEESTPMQAVFYITQSRKQHLIQTLTSKGFVQTTVCLVFS